MAPSIVIGEHFEAFIKSQLEQGRYNSASDVVRDGLRILEDREKLRAMKLEELRAEVQKGMDTSGDLPAEEVFASLRARYERMAIERGE
jgi:antitoxin ParD1/3/4